MLRWVFSTSHWLTNRYWVDSILKTLHSRYKFSLQPASLYQGDTVTPRDKKKLTGTMTSQWHKWRHKWESDWWILSLLSTWICFQAINFNCSSFIWNYDIIMSHIRLFMISPSSLISPSATPRSSFSSDDSFAKSSSVKSISSEFTKVAVLTSVEIISLFSSKSSLRSVTF